MSCNLLQAVQCLVQGTGKLTRNNVAITRQGDSEDGRLCCPHGVDAPRHLLLQCPLHGGSGGVGGARAAPCGWREVEREVERSREVEREREEGSVRVCVCVCVVYLRSHVPTHTLAHTRTHTRSFSLVSLAFSLVSSLLSLFSWPLLLDAEDAVNPVRSADLAAVLMDQGKANLCLITTHMTLVRARIQVNIPKKRKMNASARDKVCM